MNTSRNASMVEALIYAQGNGWPNILRPFDMQLKNGTTVTAIGDLMMLDVSSNGVSTASTGTRNVGEYFQVIAPTVAGNLAAAGRFHCVALEVTAANAMGWFRFYGDVKVNFAATGGSATVGQIIGTNGTARTVITTNGTTSIVTLTKIIGLTKIASTDGGSPGLSQIFFNGFPPGLAIAP